MKLLLVKFLLFTLLTIPAFSLTLKEKLLQGQPGDFIVTKQNQTISLLLLRSLSAESLVLEEICLPENQIDSVKTPWKVWAETGAPGHTSWIAYEIDLGEDRLKEGFSYTKRGWLFLDESEYFLADLLVLNLQEVSEAERKRVGPAPAAGEKDTRKLWSPPIVAEGKKQEKPQATAWKASWKKDASELSQSEVELYFDSDRPLFPFPLWIDVKTTHYTHKIRAIDSGSGLISPVFALPYRPPQFAAPPRLEEKALRFALQAPRYYREIHLFAIDVENDAHATIPLPAQLQRSCDGKQTSLEVSKSDLDSLLIKGHTYRFALVPQGVSNVYVESEELFSWK